MQQSNPNGQMRHLNSEAEVTANLIKSARDIVNNALEANKDINNSGFDRLKLVEVVAETLQEAHRGMLDIYEAGVQDVDSARALRDISAFTHHLVAHGQQEFYNAYDAYTRRLSHDPYDAVMLDVIDAMKLALLDSPDMLPRRKRCWGSTAKNKNTGHTGVVEEGVTWER